jgi:nitrite reductase/ring-hydroxylating ferredoxin subunit
VARWFAVGRGAEVVPRHIAQTQLLGTELALWRDDAGSLNAWENRCPHRGVRLSIGTHAGTELRCQYHGWRFASGSGQCTVIPAHPSQKPASGVHVRTYSVVERYHLVWVSPDADSTPAPSLPIEDTSRDTTLRSMFINAAVQKVAHALADQYGAASTDEFTLRARGVIFLLQPVTQSQTILHGVTEPEEFGTDRLAALRQYNSRLSALRDEVETSAP